MSKDGIIYLCSKVEEALDYARAEFDLSYAEAIGTLDIAKIKLHREMEEEEEDLDLPEDPG